MSCNVAIVGISSKLAREVAAELLKRPDVPIRGSCRDTSKMTAFLQDVSRVTVIQSGPADTDSLRSLVRGCEVVICCYYADNETMIEGQKLLIDLCEEEGVHWYMTSDYNVDFTKPDRGDVAIKGPRKHVKAYLDHRSRVKGVHILVGLLMETFWEYLGIWDPKHNKVRYWGAQSSVLGRGDRIMGVDHVSHCWTVRCRGGS